MLVFQHRSRVHFW